MLGITSLEVMVHYRKVNGTTLITTGQRCLHTDINAVSSLFLGEATGQTLQTQITSNDTEISNLTSNVITTGQTLTSEITIVSGIAEAHTDISELSGNLITTGSKLLRLP